MSKKSKSEGVTHISTVDTLMEDIGVRPALIGDMVNFRDEAGIKWRGVVLDIRSMVTLMSGVMIREDMIDALIPDPGLRRAKMLTPEKWAFVACFAQPQTVAVKLTHCWPHERGWWHAERVAAPPNGEPMSERELVYREEVERCRREVEKHRRAILKAEEWSAEHNDGQRDLGGLHYTETLPKEIGWLQRESRRFTRLANKAKRRATPSPESNDR